MKTVYLNQDNTVREIIPPEASPITDFYSADFCTRCVETNDEVQQHWVYHPDTGSFTPPPDPVVPDPEPPTPTSPEALRADIERMENIITALELAVVELYEGGAD